MSIKSLSESNQARLSVIGVLVESMMIDGCDSEALVSEVLKEYLERRFQLKR